MKRVFRIAVGTPEVTVGQPDERGGQTCPGGFTLDAVEDLVYYECGHANALEGFPRHSTQNPQEKQGKDNRGG